MNVISEMIYCLNYSGNVSIYKPKINNIYESIAINLSIDNEKNLSYGMSLRKHNRPWINDYKEFDNNEKSIVENKNYVFSDNLSDDEIKLLVANIVYENLFSGFLVRANHKKFNISNDNNDVIKKIFKYASSMLDTNNIHFDEFVENDPNYNINKLANCKDDNTINENYHYSIDKMMDIIDEKMINVKENLLSEYVKSI